MLKQCCISCKHFSLDMGQEELSDVTPAVPASMRCLDGRFSFDGGARSKHVKETLYHGHYCSSWENNSELEKEMTP